MIGPPGIGKTAIMEQVALECGINLVSYTITHHTRQSAIGLPFISHKNYGGREYAVTEYTMSEIIASVYDQISWMRSTVSPKLWRPPCCSSSSIRPSAPTGFRTAS